MALSSVTKSRVQKLLYFLVFLHFVIISGTVIVQRAKGARWREQRAKQGLRKITLQGHRGRILDRMDRVFAMNVPYVSIYVNPSVLEEKETKKKYIEKLSEGMKLSRREVGDLLSGKQKDGVIWLERNASVETVKRVRELGLHGVDFRSESHRVYPKGSLGAGVVGFFGKKEGMEGIEYVYEEYLRGEKGYKLLEKDARGRNVPFSTIKQVEPRIGMDVTLTIDQAVQHHAETALKAGVKKYGAESGSALVIEVETGRILAMASYPTFDPNHYGKYSHEHFRNRTISMMIEHGSTMKSIVVASAIDSGVVDPFKDKFLCEKSFVVNGRKIREHTSKGLPAMKSVTEIVTDSYNTGSARIAMKLGRKKLKRYLEKFHFGTKYEIGLNGQAAGMFPADKRWRDVTVATLGYGYGLSATALQMAMAYSVIANDGVLMQPAIIEKITAGDGRVEYSFKPTAIRRVLKPETTRIMRYVLHKTVQDGTGKKAQLKGYYVAGKTGTAKMLSKGGYVKSYHSSFIGMAPADDPKLLVMVLIDKPKTSYYASDVAAPVFGEIMEKALWTMNVSSPGYREGGVVAY